MFGLEEKASEQEVWIPAEQQGRRERMPLVRRSAWVSGGRAEGGLRQEQAPVWGPGSQSWKRRGPQPKGSRVTAKQNRGRGANAGCRATCSHSDPLLGLLAFSSRRLHSRAGLRTARSSC